jgi:hypothetical protein
LHFAAHVDETTEGIEGGPRALRVAEVAGGGDGLLGTDLERLRRGAGRERATRRRDTGKEAAAEGGGEKRGGGAGGRGGGGAAEEDDHA